MEFVLQRRASIKGVASMLFLQMATNDQSSAMRQRGISVFAIIDKSIPIGQAVRSNVAYPLNRDTFPANR